MILGCHSPLTFRNGRDIAFGVVIRFVTDSPTWQIVLLLFQVFSIENKDRLDGYPYNMGPEILLYFEGMGRPPLLLILLQ